MSTAEYEALAEEIRQKRNYREEADGTVFCQIGGCLGSTGLRCYRTSVPICMKCAVKTPVGYISREAAREQQDKFFTALPRDYLITVAIAFFLNLGLGYIAAQIGFIGFFGLILMSFWGTFAAGILSEAIWRALNKRRGRYTGRVAAGAVFLSSLLVFFVTGSLLGLLIYTVIVIIAINARFQVGLRL